MARAGFPWPMKPKISEIVSWGSCPIGSEQRLKQGSELAGQRLSENGFADRKRGPAGCLSSQMPDDSEEDDQRRVVKKKARHLQAPTRPAFQASASSLRRR